MQRMVPTTDTSQVSTNRGIRSATAARQPCRGQLAARLSPATPSRTGGLKILVLTALWFACAIGAPASPAPSATAPLVFPPPNSVPPGATATNSKPPATVEAQKASTPRSPEIGADRHLVRVERLLPHDPDAALGVMNDILDLHDAHNLILQDAFRFKYAQVALAAGRTKTAIEWLHKYLAATGTAGDLYREALELLDAAELRRSPPIFDRTPFRDKTRVFYNTPGDPFSTEGHSQHYPASRCVYPELFLTLPSELRPDFSDEHSECDATDTLRDGAPPIALEAQFVGDVGFGSRKVRDLALTVEEGGRDGGFHWTWQSYATMMLKLRMMRSRSRPVLPPSFMPKGTFQVIGLRKEAAHKRRATMHVLNLVGGHHSNGQTGCTFSDQYREPTGGCISVREEESRDGRYVNFANGNFSTHYFQASWYIRRMALSSSLGLRSEASYGFGLERHFGGVPGALDDELERLYGRNRLWMSFARETKRYEYSARIMTMLGAVVAPFWAEGEFVVYVAGRNGIYVRAYRGQDPYNIQFAEPIARFEIGLTFGWEGAASEEAQRWR